MSEKTDIKSMDLEELKTFFSDMGEKAFRAKQVYEWLHVRQVESFEEMTNLSKTLRERLDETCRIITLRKEQVQISKLDGTRKYLFLLEDGNVIESVLMKYKHGNSVCISSQVGCRMGCRFCASTLDGLVRGLAPAEMLDQIYQIGKDIGERISNVVVAGMISGGIMVFVWKFLVRPIGGSWNIYELLPAFIIASLFKIGRAHV